MLRSKPHYLALVATTVYALVAGGAPAELSHHDLLAPRALSPVAQPGSQRASLTPDSLFAVLGPLAPLHYSSQIAEMRSLIGTYAQTERARYQEYLACQATCFVGGLDYGGFLARLMWAIRVGEPIGPGVTDETKYAYARGRRIVKRYLQYSKANHFAIQPHNNTGMADVEALYLLEGDPDALTHIHVTAMSATTDNWGYLKMQNRNADGRIITVALQAVAAAHRLGIPYARNPANTSMGFDASLGSWKAVGDRQITWLTQYDVVKADGSIPSPAHSYHEAYLFNAWMATALLKWCATVEWNPQAFALAKRIMDHLVNSLPPGWETLGYLDDSTTPAWDLAGFYVWPSLVLWQETGDQRYYDFALSNLRATRHAYTRRIKQWNQTFGTLTLGADALAVGVRWRRNGP